MIIKVILRDTYTWWDYDNHTYFMDYKLVYDKSCI